MKNYSSNLLIFLSLSFLLLAGCGTGRQVGSDVFAEEQAPEPISGTVYHTIIACKYLVFDSNDFAVNYENGRAFSRAIDAWVQLRYSVAEENFLLLAEEMEEKGPAFPEDRAFLCEAIGCLYIDMAKYPSAYEYLMDAYVTMKAVEVYSQTEYYQNAVATALCHYYYAMGDYERCRREVQSLLDNNVTDNVITDQSKSTRDFLNIILNNISAQISFDCGRYADAWNTYTESMHMCQAAQETQRDPFMTGMLAHVYERLGDTAYQLSPEYWETAITTFYDGTVKILETNFSGPFAGAAKARVLMKKGYALMNFAGKADEAFEIATKAMHTQENLYGLDNPYPGLVDTYLKYGDILGYIYQDFEGAETYYDKALSLSKSAYGENHPETARVYETLGRFYNNLVPDSDEKSIELLQQGLEVCKNLLMENTALAAGIELQLAGVYKGAGDDAASDMYKEHSLEIYDKLGIHLFKPPEAEK